MVTMVFFRLAVPTLNTHPKRLRKLLHAAGYIGDEAMGLTDDRTMFDAADADGFLRQVSGSMSLCDVRDYLNVPRPHEQLLYEAGFICPFVSGGTGAIRSHAFARGDLDAFMNRLLADAELEESYDQRFAPIPVAAKKCCCSAMTIVGLLLDKALTKVLRTPHARGYLSVLVDINEVRSLVRGEAHSGLTSREIERRLRTSTKVVRSLIDHGYLPSVMRINPVNRCPQRIVLARDLDQFMNSL